MTPSTIWKNSEKKPSIKHNWTQKKDFSSDGSPFSIFKCYPTTSTDADVTPYEGIDELGIATSNCCGLL